MKWDRKRAFCVSLVFAVVLVPAAFIPTVREAPWFKLLVAFAFMTVVVALISFLKARGASEDETSERPRR
ncbi:MAG TPA: hypothetical protein PLY56_18355, partial [Armatimonadota bacterium]|nr:hypothetical protein [Armatimonadota bacterium]